MTNPTADTPRPAQDPARSSQVWNLPNVLTMLRIVMVPFFVWALLADRGADGAPEYAAARWVAFGLFAAAMYTDMLDGQIARKRNLITDFGKIADPIADKALTGAAMIVLSVLGDLPWWITIVILVREWGITFMRLGVVRYGVMAASKGGKLKTVLQTLGLGMLLIPFTANPVWHLVAMIVVAAALIVTVVTGVDYVIKAARLVAASRRAPGGRGASRA
ncbi:CDP-diacylglycerol--glycerol-3-phosphate 3-phosphatidyltransferase [Falsarthrobacter nasiphocae]|uniref:CDP-diacylglycerol--glycerol-3-phosphate 3-phosphatidyltransferase n=1 Tax=Falsarthrobacter nasiphocae TaxID=189863 RepID=A0AAE3YIA4_9MICC|nr:CDP-diacylglycerol--glycerol-3-phosphate 3-phosphatidyltransferase [Falsarthrobacter nasiphocae]MDR6892669.1 CDP-diacylglycerol--glycerol-3-phosphate 3-phosphatidyltransferase [Falsarthrobacter nasiphocae]